MLQQQQPYAGKLLGRMMEYGGSQDSLDDNIGVDNMMCHRLLGGKGKMREFALLTLNPFPNDKF